MGFSEVRIDLTQMIMALETTVDLVGMNDTNHGKRVGYIASQIAHRMGLSEEEIRFAFQLGLLHDCGVSTEQMHNNLVNHFDWEDSHIHCEIGHRLLKHFEPLQQYAAPILYHHTPYEELKTLDISDDVARMANLIFLSDRVDVLAASHYGKDILLARDEVVKSIQGYSDSYFDPGLIEAFMEVERSEAFWISLEDRHITRYTWDMGQHETTQVITIDQVKQLALIMAYIVDQKSPFTAQHSARVGSLARYIAKAYGLSIEQCIKIEIAGFLHDIGKLRIPDYILEKPGPLNNVERAIINHHSYETYEILRNIKGLEEIARWAAYHHEGIDGTGYPFHPVEREISIEARILAVADIFQALVQDRPYRDGMTLEKVLTLLDNFVREGKIDPEIAKLVHDNSAKCFAIAKGEAEENRESEIPFFTKEDIAHLQEELTSGIR